MATYTLTNTAKEIDGAVQAVTNADTAPQQNSQNMVTSGGVHTAINNLDLSNLAGNVLTTESDGIANYDTDANIPTNAAVKDYVDTEVSTSGKTIQTGWTTLLDSYENQINPAGYTRTNACFVYVEIESRSSNLQDATLTIGCEGINFTSTCNDLARGSTSPQRHSMTHVVPANTNFTVSVSPSSLQGTQSFVRIRVKDFSA